MARRGPPIQPGAVASLLCRARGIGVSAPKPDDSQIPWRDCPWLLQDHLDLRKMVPPMWCYNIKDAGQAECERAYLSPVDGSGLYHRCVYSDGFCKVDKEGDVCQLHSATPAFRCRQSKSLKCLKRDKGIPRTSGWTLGRTHVVS